MTANESLCDALKSGRSLERPLLAFVHETGARAAGLWRLVNGHLEMIGFASVEDMPRDVAQAFCDTTRRVSLAQNQFGIIRAVNTEAPTLARRDPGDTGLTGSASWNARFGTETSLAIPVRSPSGNQIVGAIAVATQDVLHEGHVVWNRILQLAVSVGTCLD